MEEPVRARLGPPTAHGVAVRTFHSLGMVIIGDVEGKRPALARTAENDRALFDLLKGIVADLLADGALSETVLEWFQDRFAPYRSEHEFDTWGAYWNYIRRNDIRSLKGDKVKPSHACRRQHPRRSRPMRASLASRPMVAFPVTPKCFSRSRYLLQPLRLLPAGATVAGRDSHPLRDGAFPRRTE